MGSGLRRDPCNSSSSDVFTSFLLPPRLMPVLSRLSGHLLPTGTSDPQDKGPAESWGKLCLGQALPLLGAGGGRGSWTLESEIKEIYRQAGRQAGATWRTRKMYVGQLEGCSLSWKLQKELLGGDKETVKSPDSWTKT